MPMRDVMIRLGLNAGPFIAGTRAAGAASSKLSKDIATDMSKGSRSASVLGSSFGTVGLIAGAVGVKMIASAANFDQAMSNVAATGKDATANMGKLRQAALDAGAATKYSATEAAGGVEALAKAGVSSADVLGGGLKGALSLAAAGNLDVAGSAEAAASAMNQFQLKGKDVPHIADLLAAGAGKAQGEVSDMAMALNQAGLIAHGAGANIEETTGTLAAFASAGLIGSDAGTSFKTMLQRLQAPMGNAKKLMSDLGITAYDLGTGKFLGLANIAGQLRDKLSGMNEKQRASTLAILFGSDAVRAANILYSQGEGGIKKWTKAVNDAGYAADVAAKKQDNLKGDLENLKGSLETVFIKGGEGSQGGLRSMTQDLTDIVNASSEAGNGWQKLMQKLGLRPKTTFDSAGFFRTIKELAQALNISGKTGVDTETIVKFKTEGAPKAVADAAKVAEAANLTPKDVRSVLHLLGWDTKHIDAVIAGMNKIDRRQLRAFLKLQGFDLATIRATVKAMTPLERKRLRVVLQKAGFSTSVIDDVIGSLEELDKHKNTKVTGTIKVTESSPLRALIDNLIAVGALKPAPVVDVPTTKAKGGTDTIKRYIRTVKGKTVYIDVVTRRSGKSYLGKRPGPGRTGGRVTAGGVRRASGGGISAFDAWGGEVAGPGSEVSDSIPAMLSNGEHVLTASDVRKAGGQDAIYRMRDGIQSGLYRFSSGGAASSSGSTGPSAKQQAAQELKESAKSDLQSIKSTLAELKGEVKLFESVGDSSPWISAGAGGGSFAARAMMKLTQIKTLAGKLYQLRQLGLNGALLSEIYGLGSQAGIIAADELLKNTSEIAQLNSAFQGIQQTQAFEGALFYKPTPSSDPKISISLKDITFDPHTLKAGMTVIAKNASGKVLAQEKWNSLMSTGV